MKKLLAIPSVLVLSAISAFADSNIEVPEPDYTDFYALAGVVIAISTVVMLVKRAKGLFR